jgi:hypothetical protein
MVGGEEVGSRRLLTLVGELLLGIHFALSSYLVNALSFDVPDSEFPNTRTRANWVSQSSTLQTGLQIH